MLDLVASSFKSASALLATFRRTVQQENICSALASGRPGHKSHRNSSWCHGSPFEVISRSTSKTVQNLFDSRILGIILEAVVENSYSLDI
jgi:hypothetical protein